MSFRTLITEGKDTIDVNDDTIGNALAYELARKEDSELKKAIKTHPDASAIDFFIEEIEDKSEKYSYTVKITCAGAIFSLYAANGKLRLGAGGRGVSTEEHVQSNAKNIVNYMIKNISKFKIV